MNLAMADLTPHHDALRLEYVRSESALVQRYAGQGLARSFPPPDCSGPHLNWHGRRFRTSPPGHAGRRLPVILPASPRSRQSRIPDIWFKFNSGQGDKWVQNVPALPIELRCLTWLQRRDSNPQTGDYESM